MASSARDKFDAAVKVIRGLPANGPFQPSHDLMLKFYSYYKQATEGPCTLPKPGFWDIVNKKKWEAWMKLGNMEKEKAMLLYVDELKKVSNHVRQTCYPPKIVETMPQTEEVNVFLHKLDTFYEMVEETQENHNNNVKDTDGQGDLTNADLNSLAGEEATDFNHSDNLSLLLKQDMKNAQESSGILVSEDRRNGDHGSHNGDDSNGVYINGDVRKDDEAREEEDDDDEEEEEEEEDTEDELDEEEEVVRAIASQKFTVLSANPLSAESEESGKEEQAEEGSTRNGVIEWSESETENEEFCDTSDELAIQPPANSSSPPPPSSFPSTDRTNPFPASSAPTTYIPNLSSTPLPPSKTVRINSAHISASPLRTRYNSDGQRLISDSLEVNVSGIGVERQNETLMNATTNSVLFSDQDSSLFSASMVGSERTCRGKEEKDGRDHRRKGGSHSSRGGARGGGRGAAGAGGKGAGGSDGYDGGARHPNPNSGGGGSRGPSSGLDNARTDLNEQIVVTLLRLQRDMSGVLNRLHSLEALVKEGRREEKKQLNKHWWWPFPDLSFKSAVVIVLWPIILQMVLRYLARRRKKFLK